MKNKKLVYILIPLILIIVLATFIFYKKSLTTPNLNVETEKECNHEPMLYYEYNDRKIYSYCLSNIEISINNEKTELKDYLLKNDPHSPKKARVNGVLAQFEEFYETYNVEKGDKMYIKPEDRLVIW